MSEEHQVKTRFWPKLAAVIARVPFAETAAAAWFCAMDSATPAHVRATLLAALAYFILPFDAIPDMLAGIGFTDDLAVLTTAVALMRSHMTEAHYEKARAALARLRAGQPAPV